jgi:F-type H+-transporting ATPase subunit b
MEILKFLSTSEIVAQVLSFLILLFIIKRFAWQKILFFLDTRKNRIAAEFKHIDDTKAEIAKLQVDYEAKLAAIEQAAQKIIQESVAQGKIVSEEARKKAQLDAQGIIENAKQSIKYELAKAKEELKEEVIDLTIRATENLIQQRLTADDDKKLVRDFLEGIDKI